MIEQGYSATYLSVLEQAQHHHFTHALRGLLPVQVNSHQIKRVLDLNCRAGFWAIDLALAYPGVTVTGVDSDSFAIALARQSTTAERMKRVQFYQADLRQTLNFGDDSFDFVHFLMTFPLFRPAEWAPFLKDCLRVMKPGAGFNLVVFSLGLNSSEAGRRVSLLVDTLLYEQGYSFSDRPVGNWTPGVDFYRLLQETGFSRCSYLIAPVDLGGWNNPQGRSSCQLFLYHALRSKELFLKHGLVSGEEFDALMAQARQDILEVDFCAAGVLISAFAVKE